MKNKKFSYWTAERVRNGLIRFVRDFYQGREAELPWNLHSYRISIPVELARNARRLRLYPPYQIVARYYESLPEAWAELGYEVADRGREYWTREEVLRGLRRFFDDFEFCPTSTEKYHEKSQFSEKFDKIGRQSLRGAYNKYPCFTTIRKYFGTMREAWAAAGFDVDKHWEPWSPLEDWFILESVGIMPRSEVAIYIKRTVPAIKRRLYDLGRLNSKNRWGISINKAATLLGLTGSVIQKYLEYGKIPCFRGNKLIYLNPADLLEVREFDWSSRNLAPELEKLVKRCLVQRILKIIKYGNRWRDHEIYKFHKTRDFLSLRIKQPRRSPFFKDLPPPPNDLQVGDWITVQSRFKQISEGRKGVVKSVYFSPQKQLRKDGTKRESWMAQIEFPKIKRFTPEGERRVRYSLPLDMLQKAVKPEVEPKPLSMKRDAVRSRERFTKHVARARTRFNEIKEEIS